MSMLCQQEVAFDETHSRFEPVSPLRSAARICRDRFSRADRWADSERQAGLPEANLVAAGDVTLDRRIRRTADDVDAFHQHDVPVFVDDARPRPGRRRWLRDARLHDLTDKAVAESVHRADENRLARGI